MPTAFHASLQSPSPLRSGLALRYHQSSNGGVTTSFALLSTFVVIASGIALDFVQRNRDHERLQAATDAAALAAAHEFDKQNWTTAALTVAASTYLTSNASGLSGVTLTNVTPDTLKKQVTVAATMPGRRVFSSLFLDTPTTVRASATAIRMAGTVNKDRICLLALEPSAPDALIGSGGTTFNGNNCGVQVNSTSGAAVTLSGGSRINSTSNCFVGRSQPLSAFTPAPDTGCKPVPDPFSAIRLPDLTGPCNHTGLSLSTSTTLSPGVYCGNLSLRNQTYTFNPGLYIIRGGLFTSSGGATFTGDGVTFLLAGPGAGINWSGGGSYRLTAMKTGPLAGFVAYLDPKAAAASTSTVSGGGSTYYEGAFYLPTQRVTLSGGTVASSISPFTAFVARSFNVTGGGTVSLSLDTSKTGVPVPYGLQPVSANTRLVR